MLTYVSYGLDPFHLRLFHEFQARDEIHLDVGYHVLAWKNCGRN
jgi:hypothetical protein